jgi:DNA-directed RNA polymerases I, II, and III subunit RPABC1
MEDKKQIVPQALPIEKSHETKFRTVITNIIKMIIERGLIKKERENSILKNIFDNPSDDNSYKIELDNAEAYTKHTSIKIKIIYQKITSISKSSGISEFLNKNKSIPKIIVVTSISPKSRYAIQSDPAYPNTEIFTENELLINLVDHVAIPKHILLSESETEQVLKEYSIKKREMPRILITDPVTRYFNAKIGEVFKIIRPSETAGSAPYYRHVVMGQIKD